MTDKHAKAVNRVGVRYGRTIRRRVAKVEASQRGKHKCPYCSYQQTRREAAGIWKCGKCGKKFTSRAYTVVKAAKPRVEESTEV
ncbi:50S ribosomal protein L37ae [Candidatus Woesearchaeota archaeon]|nr:MAG: 50S ribosomal protein L37ae [Candidatus Woesearchaeota archaeon]